jgi:hypothetical protein
MEAAGQIAANSEVRAIAAGTWSRESGANPRCRKKSDAVVVRS